MSILDIKIEGERYMHANDEIISLADFRKKLKGSRNAMMKYIFEER